MANVSITPGGRRSIIDRLGAWFAASGKALREARADVQLRNNLRDVDDHLLRDMGLTWTGRRYERAARNEEDWR